MPTRETERFTVVAGNGDIFQVLKLEDFPVMYGPDGPTEQSAGKTRYQTDSGYGVSRRSDGTWYIAELNVVCNRV